MANLSHRFGVVIVDGYVRHLICYIEIMNGKSVSINAFEAE